MSLRAQVEIAPNTTALQGSQTSPYIQGLEEQEPANPEYRFGRGFFRDTIQNQWNTFAELPEDIALNLIGIIDNTKSIFSTYQDIFVQLVGASTRIHIQAAEIIGQLIEEGASTRIRTQADKTIEQQFLSLFANACDEVFEDGMDSAFSRGFIALTRKYGDRAFETLADLIIGERVNPEVAAEALRWLGYIENPFPLSYVYRLWLLARALQCSSATVRDGAILGLAAIDDPSAIPYIEKAVEREYFKELREDMLQVVEQLKDTQRKRT